MLIEFLMAAMMMLLTHLQDIIAHDENRGLVSVTHHKIFVKSLFLFLVSATLATGFSAP